MTRALLVVAVALLLSACDSGPSAPYESPATDSLLALEAMPATFRLCEGMQRRFYVQLAWLGELPAPIEPPEVLWESRTPEVVRVDSSGTVHAVAPGVGYVVAVVGWPGMQAREEARITVLAGQASYEGGLELAPGVVTDRLLVCR